jgi:GTP cyclohydrolase I
MLMDADVELLGETANGGAAPGIALGGTALAECLMEGSALEGERALERPTRLEAEAAVRMLIRWAGDDPRRAGLRDTPARVARAYEEWFRGYGQDPAALLTRTFDEIGDYDEAVELRDIPFHSFCEHHMAAIRGRAHIAYVPVDRVVGISKLARVVEACARRLQIQERLTDDIASAIDLALRPRGVAVVLDAEHACMTTRGVNAHGARMVTRRMLGSFREDAALRRDFLASLGL